MSITRTSRDQESTQSCSCTSLENSLLVLEYEDATIPLAGNQVLLQILRASLVASFYKTLQSRKNFNFPFTFRFFRFQYPRTLESESDDIKLTFWSFTDTELERTMLLYYD